MFGGASEWYGILMSHPWQCKKTIFFQILKILDKTQEFCYYINIMLNKRGLKLEDKIILTDCDGVLLDWESAFQMDGTFMDIQK